MQVLCFNDILVFFDMQLKEKKERRKKEETWPLELVWIEKDPGSSEGFNLLGTIIPSDSFCAHNLMDIDS